MSAPTTLPPWDSSNANISGSISTDHQDDGYDIGEIPTSTELNLWFQLISLWINYFGEFPRPLQWQYTLPVPENASTGPLETSTWAMDATHGYVFAVTPNLGNAVLPVSDLPEGRRHHLRDRPQRIAHAHERGRGGVAGALALLHESVDRRRDLGPDGADLRPVHHPGVHAPRIHARGAARGRAWRVVFG